jgi:hypothetical protein
MQGPMAPSTARFTTNASALAGTRRAFLAGGYITATALAKAKWRAKVGEPRINFISPSPAGPAGPALPGNLKA